MTILPLNNEKGKTQTSTKNWVVVLKVPGSYKRLLAAILDSKLVSYSV